MPNAPSTPALTAGREALEGLRGRLRGTLMLSGDASFDEARAVWNAMIDRRPAGIARCAGVADVVACVRFARETEIPLAMRGGGHNIAGLGSSDGGLVADLSAMRGVWVDPAARRARAQAGCLLGDVDRETQLYGLAAVLGFVSNTGIAGLTLGGGFGYLTRRWGWTSDNVLSMDVVTAEGKLVRASESENPDLFWGLRGGGGNFGAVTSFEYALHPVGPEIVGGAIAWRGEEASEVFERFRTFAAAAPPELACVALYRPAPPSPWLPAGFHGKPIAAIVVCHSGSVADAERALNPLKSFANPLGDVIIRRPYTVQQSLLDATQPKGRRYYWKSEYVGEVSTDLLAKVIEHGQAICSPHSAVILFPVGGALSRWPEDHSPVGNRDAQYVLNIAASWERPEDDAANVEWARAAWRDMRRFSTGGTYVNFLTEEEGGERLRAAYGENFERLVDVKTQWDPTNLFRTNKNIVPRGRLSRVSSET